MDFRLTEVTSDVYALAVWDNEWQSFNNCYILLCHTGLLLIDSGKAEHTDCLVQALGSLGKSPSDVSDIVFTHGHKDHIGGSCIFPNAQKWIHANDLDLLADKSEFIPIRKNEGIIHGLQFQLMNYHTRGSIIFYEPERKIMFCGDILGFFRQPLPPEGLVSEGTELRKWFIDLVLNLSPEEKSQIQFDQFIKSIHCLLNYSSDFLCPGHGAVLQSSIKGFLLDITRVS